MSKTLVLGLDGATFRVLDPLIERGSLPNIASLRKQGASGTLQSTMPPVTGPAWLSLATGRSPGSTGVYDFIKRAPDSNTYDFNYVDSGAYQGRAIWDYLGDSGTKVGVIDYPTLSPPYEVNGFVISGGLGSAETRAYPDTLQSQLDDFPNVKSHIDISDNKYQNLSIFVDDINTNLSARVDRMEQALTGQDWSFCWAVLQEPDWVQHLMWNCFDTGYSEVSAASDSERDLELFIEFWRRIDQVVGRFSELVGEDGNLIIQSDHGFGPMYNTCFRLNTWLQSEGYLSAVRGGSNNFRLKKGLWNLMSWVAATIRLKKFAPGLFNWGKNEFSSMGIGLSAIDLDKSVVFDPGHIQSMGGLYINDTLVTDTTERERLITELQKKLKALGAENDLPIKTHRPKELYDKTTDNSPDLLVRIDGVNIENAGWNRPIIDDCPERLSHQNGTHRRDGIFIAAGPDFESTIIEDAVTWDVAPTLLHLFAEPIPEAMDGRVLSEALSTDRSVTIRESGVTVETETLLDDDEEQEMQRQLGNLGYFE